MPPGGPFDERQTVVAALKIQGAEEAFTGSHGIGFVCQMKCIAEMVIG
jgi:hypothetical protein